MKPPDPPKDATRLSRGRWHLVDPDLPGLRGARHRLEQLITADKSVLHSVAMHATSSLESSHTYSGDEKLLWATVRIGTETADIKHAVGVEIGHLAKLVECGAEWQDCADTIEGRVPEPQARRDLETGEVTASGGTTAPLTAEQYKTAAEFVVDSPPLLRAFYAQPSRMVRRAFVAEVAAERRHREHVARIRRNVTLDLGVARRAKAGEPEVREPPKPGRGSLPVWTEGERSRWVTFAPGLPERIQWHKGMLVDLCGEGPFRSITVREGRLDPPRGGLTSAYTDTDGDSHLIVTIADDLNPAEVSRIFTHELGHVSDACAAGGGWADVFHGVDRAEQVAERFERRARFDLSLGHSSHALAAVLEIRDGL